MATNPYDTLSKASPTQTSAYRHSRGMALIITALSLLGFGVVGFQLLAWYAFSTMVDPTLPESERSRIIADRFLFSDGSYQVVLVFMFAVIAATGLASGGVHLAVAIFHAPTARTAMLLSCIGGLLGAITLVAVFLLRCA